MSNFLKVPYINLPAEKGVFTRNYVTSSKENYAKRAKFTEVESREKYK